MRGVVVSRGRAWRPAPRGGVGEAGRQRRRPGSRGAAARPWRPTRGVGELTRSAAARAVGSGGRSGGGWRAGRGRRCARGRPGGRERAGGRRPAPRVGVGPAGAEAVALALELAHRTGRAPAAGVCYGRRRGPAAALARRRGRSRPASPGVTCPGPAVPPVGGAVSRPGRAARLAPRRRDAGGRRRAAGQGADAATVHPDRGALMREPSNGGGGGAVREAWGRPRQNDSGSHHCPQWPQKTSSVPPSQFSRERHGVITRCHALRGEAGRRSGVAPRPFVLN